jgi:hypothetical protein
MGLGEKKISLEWKKRKKWKKWKSDKKSDDAMGDG